MTAAAEPLIGVINAGSSSLKFSFYEGERRILTGQVDGIGAHPAAQQDVDRRQHRALASRRPDLNPSCRARGCAHARESCKILQI